MCHTCIMGNIIFYIKLILVRTKCALPFCKYHFFNKYYTYISGWDRVQLRFSDSGPCPVLAGPCSLFGGPCPKTGHMDIGYSCLFKYVIYLNYSPAGKPKLKLH